MLRRAGFALVATTLWVCASAQGAELSFDDHLANLKSPNAATRESAAKALGDSRRREAVLPLSALVRDPEARVRLAVVRSLRQLRDLESVPALVTSLGDGDVEIRKLAIGGLVEVYAPTDPNEGSVLKALFELARDHERSSIASFVQVAPGVHDGLARRLRDEDAEVRRLAALALGILDGKSALPDLKSTLADVVQEVRAAAAQAIGKVGSTEDGEALIPLLSDEQGVVRSEALTALGVLQVRSAGPVLRRMFEAATGRDNQVRLLETLSRVRDERQIDLFRELTRSSDGAKQRFAIEGLARVADDSLLAALKKDFQREGSESVRLALAFAIAKLGDRAFVDSLVLGLSGSYAQRCRGYLIELGRQYLSELYPYLGDPDARIREALCAVMEAIGDPAAAPHLESLITDTSPKVADRANRAVQHLRRLARSGSGG